MSGTAVELRPVDLRRLAARTEEPERARKMLALAQHLEEQINEPAHRNKPIWSVKRDPVHAEQPY